MLASPAHWGQSPSSSTCERSTSNPSSRSVTSMLSGSMSRSASQLPAPKVVVRRDVRVELPGPGTVDHAEQTDVGELAERVVDRRPRELGKLGARPLEHLLGAQVAVRGAGEQAVDRAPLGGGAEAVRP